MPTAPGASFPEFELRPLRPGLGAAFFAKHQAQLLAHGFVVVDGVKVSFGRYFNTLAKRADLTATASCATSAS